MRSTRSRKEAKKPLNLLALVEADPPDFDIKKVNEETGYGVFSRKVLDKGDPLFLYRGTQTTGTLDVQDDSYVFEFSHKGTIYCIDASKDDESLGRMVNDENRTPNCIPKVVEVMGQPYVVFFALRTIHPGDELRYNYGSGNYPWRKKKRRLAECKDTAVISKHQDQGTVDIVNQLPVDVEDLVQGDVVVVSQLPVASDIVEHHDQGTVDIVNQLSVVNDIVDHQDQDTVEIVNQLPVANDIVDHQDQDTVEIVNQHPLPNDSFEHQDPGTVDIVNKLHVANDIVEHQDQDTVEIVNLLPVPNDIVEHHDQDTVDIVNQLPVANDIVDHQDQDTVEIVNLLPVPNDIVEHHNQDTVDIVNQLPVANDIVDHQDQDTVEIVNLLPVPNDIVEHHDQDTVDIVNQLPVANDIVDHQDQDTVEIVNLLPVPNDIVEHHDQDTVDIVNQLPVANDIVDHQDQDTVEIVNQHPVPNDIFEHQDPGTVDIVNKLHVANDIVEHHDQDTVDIVNQLSVANDIVDHQDQDTVEIVNLQPVANDIFEHQDPGTVEIVNLLPVANNIVDHKDQDTVEIVNLLPVANDIVDHQDQDTVEIVNQHPPPNDIFEHQFPGTVEIVNQLHVANDIVEHHDQDTVDIVNQLPVANNIVDHKDQDTVEIVNKLHVANDIVDHQDQDTIEIVNQHLLPNDIFEHQDPGTVEIVNKLHVANDIVEHQIPVAIDAVEHQNQGTYDAVNQFSAAVDVKVKHQDLVDNQDQGNVDVHSLSMTVNVEHKDPCTVDDYKLPITVVDNNLHDNGAVAVNQVPGNVDVVELQDQGSMSINQLLLTADIVNQLPDAVRDVKEKDQGSFDILKQLPTTVNVNKDHDQGDVNINKLPETVDVIKHKDHCAVDVNQHPVAFENHKHQDTDAAVVNKFTDNINVVEHQDQGSKVINHFPLAAGIDNKLPDAVESVKDQDYCSIDIVNQFPVTVDVSQFPFDSDIDEDPVQGNVEDDRPNFIATRVEDKRRCVLDGYQQSTEDTISTFEENTVSFHVKKDASNWVLEEYISDSDCSDIIPAQHMIPLQSVLKAAADSTSTTTEKKDEESCTDNIEIQEVQNSERRRFDKKQACYFCEDKYVIKMARHLESEHNNVQEIGSLPKYDKNNKATKAIRNKVFAKYRNLGNFNNNINVLQNKSGVFFVGRRPKEGHKLSVSEFVPCQYCLTFFLRDSVWRHVKTCTFRDNKIVFEIPEKVKRDLFVKAGESLLQGALGSAIFNSEESHEYQELVLNRLQRDDVSMCIKSDELLLLFGKAEFSRLGSLRANQVREKLRILGRLKLILRKISGKESATLGDFITVDMFDTCIVAIKQLGGISDSPSLSGTKTYNKPAIALKAGEFLKKVAGLKRGQAVRKRNTADRDEISEFIGLYDREFRAVSSVAHQTIHERKFNHKILLPLTEDLLKYVNYLEDTMINMTSSLSTSPIRPIWHKLAEVTLARVLVFNKRRSNEAARMLIEQFQSRPKWREENSELVKALQPIERHMLKQMDLVEVLGKKNRRVPVLLSKTMVNAVDALIKYRKEAVVSSNPYIFAEGNINHMKGCVCVSRTAQLAQLQYPERITSTKLRKYLATVSQLFNLSQSDLEELARHMGHELSVHRNFYRLQEDVIELAKVSRLLIAVEEGKAHKFAGCSLDDINVADIEIEEDDIETEENDHENEDGESPVFEDSEIASHRNVDVGLEDAVTTEPKKASDVGLKDAVTTKPKKANQIVRTQWSDEEREEIKKRLLPIVREKGKPPTRQEILLITATSDVLKERAWKSIKYITWAMYQKETRKKQSVVNSVLNH